jgi:hypothetical protein
MVEHALVISLTVLFIYMCCTEGMIFHFVYKWFKTWLPEPLWKPVFSCPICMTPYYGTIVYLILYKTGVVDWIFTIFTAAGMNCVFVFLLEIAHNTNPGNNKKKED